MPNPPKQLTCKEEKTKSGTATVIAAPNIDKPPARTAAELLAKQQAAHDALAFVWGFSCPDDCIELKFSLVLGEPVSECVVAMGNRWKCTATCDWSVRVWCGLPTKGRPGVKELEPQDLKCDESATASGILDVTDPNAPGAAAAWARSLEALQNEIDKLIAHVRCPEACPEMNIEVGREWVELDLRLVPPEYKLQWYVKVSCGMLV